MRHSTGILIGVAIVAFTLPMVIPSIWTAVAAKGIILGILGWFILPAGHRLRFRWLIPLSAALGVGVVGALSSAWISTGEAVVLALVAIGSLALWVKRANLTENQPSRN